MSNKIESNLIKVEAKIRKLVTRFGYSGIITQKSDGSLWYTDCMGRLVRAENADPDLVPSAGIVFPEQL